MLDLLVDAVHVQDICLRIGIFQLVEECRIQTDDGFFLAGGVFHSITGEFDPLDFLDRNRIAVVCLFYQIFLLSVVVVAVGEFDQLHILRGMHAPQYAIINALKFDQLLILRGKHVLAVRLLSCRSVPGVLLQICDVFHKKVPFFWRGNPLGADFR